MTDDLLFSPFQVLATQLLAASGSTTDGSHDVAHLARVWRNAVAIQQEEGGNLRCLAAAVLLHDCVTVEKNSPDRHLASTLAANKAREVLHALAWDPTDIELVADAIRTHSFSAGFTPSSLEARILQDADRLDAIGYTGIARCFYTAGRMESSLYHSIDPAGRHRELDDSHYALDHFPRKLLRLASQFQTSAGTRLAETRHRQLLAFYEGMLHEIGETSEGQLQCKLQNARIEGACNPAKRCSSTNRCVWIVEISPVLQIERLCAELNLPGLC